MRTTTPRPREIVLEARDIGKPLVPDPLADELRRQLLRFEQFLVHTHNEDFFVVRAIEDADAPALRNFDGVAPQEIVRQLLVGGLLERKDIDPLRIDARHDVLDRAVLARRVHCLEDEQQRPGILGVENVLLHCEPFRTALKELRRLLLVHLEPACVAGIEVLEAEVLALRDAEWIGVFPDGVENILARH